MIHETPVVFPSQGLALSGRFFRNTESLATRQPGVVISGSWLNVKEQMASHYARAFAEQGFTAFVFDFAGWGESQGSMRHVELPAAKVRDISAACEFVSTLSFVRPGGVGYLGVCASAQYAMRACAGDEANIRALVSVAGWFHDAASVAPFYGADAGVKLRLARAREALAHHQETGELRMVPAYAPGNDRAGMHFELDYYASPARGAVPAWRNQMAEVSWLHWLAYDGLSPASAVHVPTLMVHADGCALPDNAKLVYQRLGGPKRLAWLDGTQTDYYDQPQQTRAALACATAWFEEHLR